MYRPVNGDDIGESFPKALHTGLSPMRRAVIEYPEDLTRGAIRSLGHNLSHQATKRLDTCAFLAATEDLRAVHIQRGHIGPGTTPPIFVLDAGAATWSRG